MSSGSDEHWKTRKRKKTNEVHGSVCDLIRLLKRLEIIKRPLYKEGYIPMSWDRAALSFVERNRRFHV